MEISSTGYPKSPQLTPPVWLLLLNPGARAFKGIRWKLRLPFYGYLCNMGDEKCLWALGEVWQDDPDSKDKLSLLKIL